MPPKVLDMPPTVRIYPKTIQIGLPKKFIEHGTRDYIYQKYNMDSNSILKKIKEVWPELGVI